MPKNQRLREALETLLSPLGAEGEFPDAWRDAVNRGLRRWTEADYAFFRVSDGSPTRVDPLTDEILEARDAYREGGFREMDPWATRRVGPGEALVASFRDLLGDDWHETSAYYRDFLLPHGISTYVGAQVGTDGGEHVVLSFFNMWTDEDEAMIARTRRRVHAIIPALKAGIEVWLAVRPTLEGSGGMVDEIPEPLLLCDGSGEVIHANSALVRLLRSDPEEERLRGSLLRVAREFARARDGDVHDFFPHAEGQTVHTARGVYVARPVVTDGRLRGGDGAGEDGVLLLIRRKHSRSPEGGGDVRAAVDPGPGA